MKSIPYCPTVTPTHKQFSDFHAYVEWLQRTYSQNYSMVKVVPPKGWRPRRENYQVLDRMMIPGPIEQNAYGKGGVYECLHIQKKSMTVREYKRKIQCFQQLTNGLKPEEVEDMFWKNISFSPPLYGADIKLSFMDESAGAWNLANLNSVLTMGLKDPLPGVNTPYCYIGSWKTFFCWHTEDMELSAINFLHFGKPKFWYGVCAADRKILEKEAQSHFYENFQKCPEYMRHKTSVINPYLIKPKHPTIRISKAIQYPGEFILAFSGSYHCGFNFGFNFAEAVNYATYNWLNLFPLADYCNCRKDSVRVSKKQLANALSQSPAKDNSTVKRFIQEVRDEQEQLKKLNKKPPPSRTQKDEQEKYVARVLRKKLIKKKLKDKVQIKGESYKIETWAQCDKCNKWRKIYTKLRKNEGFCCQKIGGDCQRRQESNSDYIIIPTQ